MHVNGGPNNYYKKCRVCLTKSHQMISLLAPIKENSILTVSDALAEVMSVLDAKELQYLPSICGMCKGLLVIAYEFKMQYKATTTILKECFEDEDLDKIEDKKIVDKNEINAPVELIIGRNKYNLNDIVIVEDEPKEESNYEGFLNNLGSTVSAKIVSKDYKYKPVEEDSDLTLVEKEKPQTIIIEELILSEPTKQDLEDTRYIDVEQFIIRNDSEISFKSEDFIHTVSDNNENNINTCFKCEYCQKEYISKGRYLNHLKVCSCLNYLSGSDSFSKLYICPDCKQVFYEKQSLAKHLQQAHSTNEKILFCDKCDHVSHSAKALAYHTRTHGEKLHQCEICGKSFFRKNALLTHKQLHSQITQVLCPICGKSFHYKSGLVYHMKIHTKERNYVCNFCDRRFYMLNSLKRHIRTHTGIRPYRCQYCEKKFFSKGEVKKHEMLHTGVRPFKCKYCNKGFTQKFNLELHLMSHSGPHVCEFCEKTFVDDIYLRKHLKDKHKFMTASDT